MPKTKKKSAEVIRKQQKEEVAKRREDDQFREQEKEKDKEYHRKSRMDLERLSVEREKDRKAHQNARKNIDFREMEREKDAMSHQEARQDPLFRKEEQKHDTLAHQSARKDSLRRREEQVRNTVAHQVVRSDPQRRNEEQVRNTLAHQVVRIDPQRRKEEQVRDTISHQVSRRDPQRRREEQSRNTAAHQAARTEPLLREKEKERDREARKSSRLNPEIRTPEKQHDQEARALRRTDPVKRKADTNISALSTAKKRKLLTEGNFESLAEQFGNAVKESPSHVCVSCGLLNYKSNIGSHTRFNEEAIDKFTLVPFFPVQFCKPCASQISINKIPKLCLSNGLDFYPMPNELKDLTPLEERLLALRIAFMQIRPVGFIGQLKLKGTVVNVENDLSITTKIIPRNFDDSSTIQVYLMRRMKFDRPYMSENVRPATLVRAAKYLIEQELYKRNGVKINPEWSKMSEKFVPFLVTSETNKALLAAAAELNETAASQATETENRNVEASAADEEEFFENIGADESLIFPSTSTAFKIAPGEDKRPIPLYMDNNVEEMTFVRCYTGKPRPPQPHHKLSYTDIKKSELLRFDRRACSPTHVLFAMRMSFEIQLNEAFQMYLRKRRGAKVYTVGDALQPDFTDKLIRNDEGYAVWKNLRSSPPYWQSKAKQAIAMVRQEGPCTFFLTLSAAEAHWNPLLVNLTKTSKKVDISEEEAESLSSEEKAKLIRNDPVTCMRHFNHRYQKLWTLIFKRKNGLFAPYNLKDYLNRMEFQMRGSPHIHSLLWLEDAPVYEEGNPESEQKCVEFIDQFITVKRDEEGEMKVLLPRQIHKHANTCYKHGANKKSCRFGYPLPPMPKTMFLHPLPSPISPQQKERLQNIFKALKEYLIEEGRNPTKNPSFDEFIQEFYFDDQPVTEQDYFLALQSSIKRVTVFHKRELNECYINRYNRDLLLLWKANMDLQFVTDTYACASYCVSYVFKCDGGMSKLMRVAADQAKTGNKDVREQFKKYARILRNGTEVSPQESAGFLLSIKNVDSSRTDVFVNTSKPEERTVILKSNKELEELPEDSTEIYQKGILYKYSERPEELEDVCLAEFATSWEFEKVQENANIDDETPDNIIPSTRKKPRIKMRDSSGFVYKRSKKILRFRHYKEAEDPANYWREQLMLFFPWRDEEKDLLGINAQEKAAQNRDKIFENSQPYFYNREITEDSIQNLMYEIQHTEGERTVTSFNDLDEDEEYLAEKFVQDLDSVKADAGVEQFLSPQMMAEEDYLNIMRDLNLKQHKFVLHTLHKIKQNETFHFFLHGGAGVGKSRCITAVVQSTLRYYKSIPAFDFSKCAVVVAAPTGKAAYNVYGMTLHCCFNLPINEYHGAMDNIGESALNSQRTKLSNLKLIIIDEISMVSVRQLYQIDKRLRQIFNNELDFGGKSVIIVGHLRQLTPVAGRPPFDIPRHLERGELFGNYLWELFRFFELDEIMRQRDDFSLCKAFNNLSEGCMDAADISLLKSRMISHAGEPPFDTIRLFQTNAQCNAHNEWVHSQLNTDGALSTAVDVVEGSASFQRKEEFLNRAKALKISDTDGLRYETYLKVDAWYFISTNIDVSDGLFNGSTGILKKIDRNPDKGGVPWRVWMSFPDPLTGKKRRKAFQSEINKECRKDLTFKDSYTPIEIICKRLLNKHQNQALTLIRKQIPVVACNGMTIAKSQGSTMQSVVVCTGQKLGTKYRRKLTIQELYVACSRVTSLGGLFIDGEFESPKLPGPDKFAEEGETRDMVTIELDKLQERPINFDMPFLYNYDEEVFKLYFHNMQSYPLHYEDLMADPGAMQANIIALVEPHLIETDCINIPRFSVACRENCNINRNGSFVRNSEGVLVFKKDDVSTYLDGTFHAFKEKSGHCFFKDFQAIGINFTIMYRSQKYSQAKFKQELTQRLQQSSSNHVFIGDLNMDLGNSSQANLLNIFKENSFKSLLNLSQPTTNRGTTIDVCFSNNFEHAAFISESYYSHHKPIAFIF